MIPRMLHGAMGQALVNGVGDAVLPYCRKGATERPLASYCTVFWIYSPVKIQKQVEPVQMSH